MLPYVYLRVYLWEKPLRKEGLLPPEKRGELCAERCQFSLCERRECCAERCPVLPVCEAFCAERCPFSLCVMINSAQRGARSPCVGRPPGLLIGASSRTMVGGGVRVNVSNAPHGGWEEVVDPTILPGWYWPSYYPVRYSPALLPWVDLGADLAGQASPMPARRAEV